MQRIRLAWLTNGLTQNCWSSNAETTAKQPHPTYYWQYSEQYCCEETAPPLYILSVAAARTAPPRWSIPLASQPSQNARLYPAAKQLKPLAKRAASNAMMKQNWHASRGRGRSRNTESSTKWTLDNFKTCIAKKKLQQAECRKFLHGWTYTLILVISHDII